MDWLQNHQGVVLAAAGSLGVGILAMIGALVAVVRLPADFLKREGGIGSDKRETKASASRVSGGRLARNILGWLLIVAGVAMLVLPGPGMVLVLIGVVMTDLPGKQRLLRWMLSRGGILKAMNRLRARFGRPPLEVVGVMGS